MTRDVRLEKSRAAEKVTQCIILMVCVAAILVGRSLRPSPSGIGTHTELGFPPCGFYTITGIPCPTCGVTTAFVLATHLRFKDSLLTQPVGLLTFIVVCSAGICMVGLLLTGRSFLKLKVKVNAYTIAIPILGFIFLCWVYKIIITLKR
jgi:hypothetical protein